VVLYENIVTRSASADGMGDLYPRAASSPMQGWTTYLVRERQMTSMSAGLIMTGTHVINARRLHDVVSASPSACPGRAGNKGRFEVNSSKS